MARFNVVGLDGLVLDLERMAELPDEVFDDMLNAGADVVAVAQKRVGLRMGVHRTGMTLSSIKKSKKIGRQSDFGRYIDVYPQGKNADGNENAEVAFINEYGKEGQPARPFLRTAINEAQDEATEAEAEKYNEWLKSLNL